MRDKLKDENYFKKRIDELYSGIDNFLNWIETGKTPKERINIVKRAMVWDYISIIKCKYSIGNNKEDLEIDLLKAINFTFESWDGFWKLKNSSGQEYNQYVLSGYDEMLWMLSLGFLLEIPESDFDKLVEVIDRDGVKDFLYEFIIQAKIKSRSPILEESYKELAIPEIFSKLRFAIKETNKNVAENLLNVFIKKDWYNGHKSAGWYNGHKSKHDSYCGYWSFETAAIVKIMGLDDSSFRDCDYYPKDLL
jgi:hypothetical protein